QGVEVGPRVPAGSGTQVTLVRDAQGGQLLVQAVVAAIPFVGGVDGEEEVRRIVGGVDVQQGGVLAALLLAVVHLVDGRAPAAPLVIVDGRRQRRHHGKGAWLLAGQPQGAV